MTTRGVLIGGNAIPAVGTGAPVVVERRFGVDRPEVMARWLAEYGRKSWRSLSPDGQRERVARIQAGVAKWRAEHRDEMLANMAKARAARWGEKRRAAEPARGGTMETGAAERHEQAVARGRLGGLARGRRYRQADGGDVNGSTMLAAGMLTVKQAAGLLGVNVRSVHGLIERGRIKGTVAQGQGPKRARRFLVPIASVLGAAGAGVVVSSEPAETFRIKITRLRGKRPFGCRRIVVPKSERHPNLTAVVGAVRRAVGAAA